MHGFKIYILNYYLKDNDNKLKTTDINYIIIYLCLMDFYDIINLYRHMKKIKSHEKNGI